MRVALAAFSVKGAMGQYLEALTEALSELVEVHLFVPHHYDGKTGKATLHLFETGFNKREAFLRLINPYFGWCFWQQIEKVKPDIIHLVNGDPYPWTVLGVHWAKFKGLPILMTIHDPEPHPGSFIDAAMSLTRSYTMLRVTGVHIHSKSFLERVIQLGVSPSRIGVIPHGSLAQRFISYRQKDVLREAVALFFGRFEAYKGLDNLVEASLQLKGELRVIIAGPGQLPHSLLQTIVAHPEVFELHNRYLQEAEVALLFQRASVCVLPYHQATQSSLPLISAAFGTPVVATAVGGFLEDVPLVNGLLVPPANPEALAQGIREAVGRTAYYPKDYEFDVIAQKFVNFYNEVYSLQRY